MSDINWKKIEAAKLVESAEPLSFEGFTALRLKFAVPLDYSRPGTDSTTLELCAELVYHCSELSTQSFGRDEPPEQVLGRIASPTSRKPLLAYLCGGPGDSNPPSKVNSISTASLRRGYPILFLHYRGTGNSSTVDAQSMSKSKLAEHLTHFRQDSIAADLEAIRLYFGGVKYVLLGQSFGGWIALTYLSYCSAGLAGVYITGGLPPVGKTAEDTYRALYPRVIEANRKYFENHPGDQEKLQEIVRFLARLNDGKGLPLGGKFVGQMLSARGFLTMGRRFGRGKEDIDWIHTIVDKFAEDIRSNGSLSDETLELFESDDGTTFKLTERPLYAALHEAIYCSGPGQASRWAAFRVGRAQRPFRWLNPNFDFNSQLPAQEPLYFSGEMIYPFMFGDAGGSLEKFSPAAEALAQKADWPHLYDVEALGKTEVPVTAVIYPTDMYVDSGLSRETAGMINKCRTPELTSELSHRSIKVAGQTDAVFDLLRIPPADSFA